jgi:pimeloyl-ACP methyl ester carboxylesterase
MTQDAPLSASPAEHFWNHQDLVVLDHVIEVPLDHQDADGPQVELFAREVRAPDGADRPMLVFYQGGPGNESPRPTSTPPAPGWLKPALERYRVLLLDQRGTGRSTPVGPSTLTGRSVDEQVAYLRQFRADAIVSDSEALRQALGVERWSVLGQSFGGFCVLAYLSAAPESLREAFFTGGLPVIGPRIDEVYRDTYTRTIERSAHYYGQFPEDRDRVLALHDRVAEGAIVGVDGAALTWRRVRQLGLSLGYADYADKLHALLELPPDSPAFHSDLLSSAFLGTFARNPIYAVLHESCWADGGRTRWAAERLYPDEYASDVTAFTGEHVFPWMFDDDPALRPYAAVAQALAEHEWPSLYDPDRLASNTVPCAAAVYMQDMYVPAQFSLETAATVRGLRTWQTDQYQHDALRNSADVVLDHLFSLVDEATHG